MIRAAIAAILLLTACSETPVGEATVEAEEAAKAGPEAVVEAYYDAISNRDFDTAWQLWGQDPQADPDAFATFMRGFAETELATVEIGTPSEPEIGAGDVTVRIPVRIEDLLSDGTGRSYDGIYTLSRPADEAGDWYIVAGDLDIAPPEPEPEPEDG